MNRTILLGALLLTSATAITAHEIDPQNISQRTVAECIEARLEKGEAVSDVIASMRAKLQDLLDNGYISQETADACLECVNTYEYDRILRHQEA